jgi:hypothetical protein
MSLCFIPHAQNNATLFIHRQIKPEDLTEGLERNMKEACIYIEGALYLHNVDHVSIYNREFVFEMWNGQ